MSKLLISIFIGLGFSCAHALELHDKTVKVNGTNVRYYETGDKGSPLILLTGYATTSNFWSRDFVSCLSQKHRVFLVDYPEINGSGKVSNPWQIKSTAKMVNSLVSKLKLEQPALVGWSMGGAVSLEASFLAPKQYSHLYLLASAVPTKDINKLYRFAPELKENSSEQDIFNHVFSLYLYEYKPSQLAEVRSKFINPNVKALFPSAAVTKQQGAAIRQWLSDPQTLSSFSNSQVAATFFIPDHDRQINHEVFEKAISVYPHYKEVDLADSGHAVALQAPTQICKVID